MAEIELAARLKDLSDRSLRKGIITHTAFLTPAEQTEAGRLSPAGLHLSGGAAFCERKIAFFLPEYISENEFSPEEYICAIRADAPFGQLSHRDYLGALMNLGIERKSVGDILADGDSCHFFVLRSISGHVTASLEKVGSVGVRLKEVAFDQVPVHIQDVQEKTFTVHSLRADAVVSEIFGLSRSSVQRLFAAGDISVNYAPCQKQDFPINEGDMISLRHKGKAKILATGGMSRKGRMFVTAGILK